MIFAEYERSDDSPKKMGESDFAFLEHSARPEIAAVLGFVERLLEAYPQDEVAEMVARIRSGDDVAFRSAGFELLIYDFLTRLGYKLQPHPVLKNGSEKKPDFYVVAPDGGEFYLEASLATEDKGENWSANAMINSALDILNSTPHPEFFISIISKGAPTTQPGGRKIQRRVMSWLNSLDPASVSREGNFLDTNPSIDVTHEGWTLNVQALRAGPDKVGKTERLIGVSTFSAGFSDSWTPIRDKLSEKGQRYGELDLPLVVAINFSAFNLDRIDEIQALYGGEQVTFSSSDMQGEPKLSRAPNGLWHGPCGARAKRVSGAWLFNDLTFYTAAHRKHTLYFHPYPIHPLPDVLKEFPHAIMTEDFKVKWEDGISLREVLNLSESWPD
jgi:hypothetical protein